MAKQIWNRKIDQLENRRAKVYCTDGTSYVGKGGSACIADDENGNDVDGVRFKTDDGENIIFSEADIKTIEFMD